MASGLEDFISTNDIDDAAAEALRNCPVSVQQAVLDRGDLRNARNPSSVVLMRIRDATIGDRAERKSYHGGHGHDASYNSGRQSVDSDEVERFISSNGIDEHAANALRDSPGYVQAAVIDRGSLGNARNPSSVLLSRIRDVGSGSPPAARESYGGGGGGNISGRVEEFLRQNTVDDQAADTFRRCSPEVQDAVMQKGISGARNPSSALLARVRDAERDLGSGNKYPAAAPQKSPRAQGHSRNWNDTIEGFIQANSVDDRAADALRESPRHIQEVVVDRGDLSNTRNPSSALLARIRDAQAAASHPPASQSPASWDSRPAPTPHHHAFPPPGACPPPPEPVIPVPLRFLDEVEEYVRANARMEHQQWTNGLLGRIWNLRRPPMAMPGYHMAPIGGLPQDYGPAGGMPAAPHHHYRPYSPSGQPPTVHQAPPPPGPIWGEPIQDQIEAFLRANPVDDRAADALRKCSPRLAAAVMEKGISTARNPSSALLARIRDERPNFEGGGSQERGGGGGGGRRTNTFEDEVERFLRDSGADSRACDILRRCEREVQELVLERGVSGARNPSSALLARIKDAEAQRGGGPVRTGSRSVDRAAPY